MERAFGAGVGDVQTSSGAGAPAMGAAAYAQGESLNLGAGGASHLPHEAWHVTQQRQGRVQPTTQVNGAAINDDAGLEREADVMGSRALNGVAAQRLAETDDEVPSTFNMPGVNLPAPGGGNALPPEVRGKMESAFGQDFSDVRVHTGGAAASVGALAYTQGTDIHFQPGQYNPASLSGQETIGHELAHVVQQRAGVVASPQGLGAPVNADAGLEAEADALGRQAAHSDGSMSVAAPVAAAPSAAAEGAVQGLGIFDRIKSWFGGGKKQEPAAAASEPDAATVAALTGGNAEVLEATIAAEPEAAPAPSPSASASGSSAMSAEPTESAEDLPEGSEEVASALPESEIAKAAAAAQALGPDAPSIIAQSAEAGPEASGPDAAPSGPSSEPVPSNAREMAEELGVPAPSGDYNFDIDMSDVGPSTGDILAAPFIAAGQGIASGARAAGGAIYDAGAWVGNQAASLTGSDWMAAGGGGGAAVSGGTTAAMKSTEYVDAMAKGVQNIGLGGAGGVDTSWTKATETNQTLGYGGGIGSVFSAGGSLLEAGSAASDLASSNQNLITDTEIGAKGVSALSAAAQSSATAARSIEAARLGMNASTNVGNAVMAGAGTAAAGLSIATGSVDVLRGTIGAGIAESRRRELNAIGDRTENDQVRDLAYTAGTAQKDKRNDRLITAGKGALAVAGGAVLLAAGLTNPIGLGLLAGAALIGGGVALYRWWQGRKKVKDATGKDTNVSVKQQERMDRHNRANVLHAKRNEDEYKQILVSIGISPKKLATDKVTVADIEKALAPL
jgi:hypothetical protein